jgi:peptidoglycan-N-acetylglucosamine deacetylase
VGQPASQHAALARRELAEGHTVAYHSYAHPLLDRMPLAAAEAEIDHGFEAIDKALYGHAQATPATPFFRFPGFASNPPLLSWLERRGIAVFGADLWASDWNPMTSAQELRLVLERIEATHGGIVLFHDTKMRTASMLPAFLRTLKERDFRIVHTVPATGRAAR